MKQSTERATWASRSTFILAAIGSAVGLGNAWRFPGLVAKHGGATFLFVYLIAMFVMGIPLFMMEISIGRKMRGGAPSALKGIHPKAEWIGWAATSNAFVIAIYYAVVFGWVLLMTFMSYKFAGMTGTETAVADASGLWGKTIETTGVFDGFSIISWPAAIALLIAWALIYYCIRNGAHSVGKVVKYTVFLPIIILVIMAVKGLTMSGAMEGMRALFIPDLSQLSSASLWVDAIGQVFYSLSIMMAIMFAYGSFLDRTSNIAVDSIIVALSDMAISVLAGIVIFTTMYGTGMTVNDMSASGIATAFIIYPTAIINLTDIGWVNAAFGVLFYLCLVTLAIDSAFSIVEGVSTAIADKFQLSHKKTTIGICVIAGVLSFGFVTGAGLAMLDVVDNWTNNYNMIVIGILECIAVGWCFNTSKVVKEINRNTKKDGFKMKKGWFDFYVKYVSPVLLVILLCWNFHSLYQNGGVYGAADGYTFKWNMIFGWTTTIFVFVSGFVVKWIAKKKGYEDNDFAVWDDKE